MSELLAPAGNMEAFYAAVSNGADAVYVGFKDFSARAYANNFSLEELKELTIYAHLRNVKIYVAMNTILLEDELEAAFKTVDELAGVGIDALIIQDLALIDYVTKVHPTLEVHLSTQMGIDDLDGVKLAQKIGAKRVVLAREVSLDDIKAIKQKCSMPLEAFIHGALCVSYSGNCFMSALLGMRSGNRGRCVGCCRKLYGLVDYTTNTTYNRQYLLSMKDLNTSSLINKMRFIDSFKIEGRMKEPSYVASIVRYYRMMLDGKKPHEEDLYKSFQRTFTKGYLGGDGPSTITNLEKPNNYGYYIGKISKVKGNRITIKLAKEVHQGDQIRIDTKNPLEEISIPLVKIYDEQGKLINSATTSFSIDLKERVSVGSDVYKTKDIQYLKEIEATFPKEYQRLPLSMIVEGHLGAPLNLYINYEEYHVKATSTELIEPAKTTSLSYDNFSNLLSKLQDTPYVLDQLYVDVDSNAFLPLKTISTLKREAIEKLNQLRLARQNQTNPYQEITAPSHFEEEPHLVCEVATSEQYDMASQLGIKDIYFHNKVARNHAHYLKSEEPLMVGGLGSLNHYQGHEHLTTDYSFNVVNARSVALLENLGAEYITLSYENSKTNINNLVASFMEQYHTIPNLELIVYGRQKLMTTRYCPLKRLNMCGLCKTHAFALKDEIAEFPLIFNEDCTVTILNSKILNLVDDLNELKGIKRFRLVFTTESADEVKSVISMYRQALKQKTPTHFFNSLTDTRGHLNREII